MITGLNTKAAASADAHFARAISGPQALLEVRKDLPKPWLSRDMALNRSVVVLAVAAWQAWIETYVRTALDAMTGPIPDEVTQNNYLQVTTSRQFVELAGREIKTFNTPDAAGTCRLLRLIGDDPRARWSFESAGGTRDPADVMGRLNDWVTVRHAIAHGAPHLPTVDVLGTTAAGNGSLTHQHAARCVRFFRQLALATGQQSPMKDDD